MSWTGPLFAQLKSQRMPDDSLRNFTQAGLKRKFTHTVHALGLSHRSFTPRALRRGGPSRDRMEGRLAPEDTSRRRSSLATRLPR